MQWTEIIIGELQKFLDKFLAKPSDSFGASGLPWSLEEIIRCESTHFLFSCFWGAVGFSLIWTIFSSKYSKEYDRYIWRLSVLFGCACSVTTHICIDAFSTLA
jgi:hypothetical protein